MKKENWRDNCRHCPYFEECKSEKSAEECASFLKNESFKNLKKLSKQLFY